MIATGGTSDMRVAEEAAVTAEALGNRVNVRLATMLIKPASLQCDLHPDYVGMEIENDFIVGFGLDYDGLGRSTRDIYQIRNN